MAEKALGRTYDELLETCDHLWNSKVEKLKEELLKRKDLLRRYSIWLETSEENTIHKGIDIYHMLVGVLQAFSDVDFIPRIGNRNLVAVISRVQKETGLDLGVCPFLYDKDYSMKDLKGLGVKIGEAITECGAEEGLFIGSLTTCLPPERSKCEYRKAKLRKAF